MTALWASLFVLWTAGATSAGEEASLAAGAAALEGRDELEGRAAFTVFHRAATEAATGGFPRLAATLEALQPGAAVPAEHRDVASRLLRRYYLARYGRRLGPALGEMLRFRTARPDGATDWEAPEFVRQRRWLAAQAAALGLAFKSYEGRVDEITLPGPSRIVAVVAHGDVVGVEGQTWSIPPWEGRPVGDRVVGRGAMDDKGPIPPALFALAALRDSGWALGATLKVLVPNAEETDWSDIAYYLERAPAPDHTIGMDGTFPVTHGQKMTARIVLTAESAPAPPRPGAWRVVSLAGGAHLGTIPDEARAVVEPRDAGDAARVELERRAAAWCAVHPPARILVERDGARLRLIARGKAGHSAIPEAAHNALGDLTAFLATLELELDLRGAFVSFLGTAIGRETNGASLGIAHSDEVMGPLTVNLAIVTEQDGKPTAYLNPRVPRGITAPEMQARVDAKARGFEERHGARIGAVVQVSRHGPYVVPADSEIVRTLLEVWADVTGKPGRPVVTGGGTQARLFPRGVDFGPALSMIEDRSHAADEYMTLDELRLVGELTVAALWSLAR